MLYLLLGAVVVVLMVIFMFNNLVALSNRAKEGFALIDVYLKQRFDLLPNLAELARQHMSHERGIFEKIAELRARIGAPNVSENEKIGLFNELNRSGQTLFAMVENYPSLRSSEIFRELHGSWEEVEENLAAARRTFNAAVTSYNTSREQFPTNLVAGLFGFGPKNLLETPQNERGAVSAKALFN